MTSEKTKNSGFWLSFFRGAGIQSPYDTKYALVFDENRIKPDMLMDVTKDCLREMGIKAMGDIIAITKHAKKAHEESKTLAFETPKPTQLAAATTTTPAQLPDRLKPAPSTINRTVIKQPIPAPVSKAGTSTEKVTTTTPVSASKSLSERFAPHQVEDEEDSSVTTKTAAKRQEREISISSGSIVVSTSTNVARTKASSKAPSSGSETKGQKQIIRLKNSSDSSDSNSPPMLREEVPFQKKTRVLPEHEGRYKIIMPEGNTPRTVKLAQLQRTGTADKKKAKSTIFDRLGGGGNGNRHRSTVTSTNDNDARARNRQSSPSSSSSGRESRDKETKTSIFERLGSRRERSHSLERNDDEERFRGRDRSQERYRSRSRSPLYSPHETADVHHLKVVRTRGEETQRVERVKLFRSTSPREDNDRFPSSSMRNARSAKTDDITKKIGPSRMRSELSSERSIGIKSRLGGSIDPDEDDAPPPKKLTKVFPSTAYRESLPVNARIGQVLKTERGVNKAGKPVTRRFIVKRLAGVKAGTARSRLAMDDPLEDYFD